MMGEVNPSLLRELEDHLLPQERVLWVGQPSRAVLFHPSDWYAIPFSLMWGGFAIFWELGVTGMGNHAASARGVDSFMSLWGVPFVLIGQYLIWGRFLYTAWLKPRTIYALTDRRVVVLCRVLDTKVTDGSLANLPSISLSTRKDGIGTIDFNANQGSGNLFSSSRSYQRQQLSINLSSLVFYDIPEAGEVYRQIQTQREKVTARSA